MAMLLDKKAGASGVASNNLHLEKEIMVIHYPTKDVVPKLFLYSLNIKSRTRISNLK